MKTMIAVPCMDYVQTEFVQSLVRLKMPGEIRHDFLSCSLIYKARNDLALHAMAEKADYILWLDSDMVFPSDTLVNLMEDIRGRDIVSGVCHMRRPPYAPAMWSKLRQGLTPGENESQKLIDYPRDKIFTVEGCGMACVLMRVSVLDAVADKYHELFSPLPGYGEDLSFCIRARGCGFDIHVDPKVQIGHKASVIVTDETFQGYRRKCGDPE